MENAVGIIAEYNPFHKGHLYHLNEAKRRTANGTAVVVMSGNFVQRGEAAMADKWLRAEIAVRNGADLILELPFIFACNNAEYFARGAMGILKGLGCITHISFGSESGELGNLRQAAKLLSEESEEFKRELRSSLKEGEPYPKARWNALRVCGGETVAEPIREPNNILAVEYLKQALLMNWDVGIEAVKRQGAGYLDDSLSLEPVSATAIRKELWKGELSTVFGLLPEATARVLEQKKEEIFGESDRLYPLLAYKVAASQEEDLAEIFSVGEGLENKLKKAFAFEMDMASVFRAIKSKRYTETRIQRMLIHTLFGLKKADVNAALNDGVLYGRVLGFSPQGAKLLKKIKKGESASIPVLTNINKEIEEDNPVWNLLKWDVLASNLYNLLYKRDHYRNSDYLRRPFVL